MLVTARARRELSAKLFWSWLGARHSFLAAVGDDVRNGLLIGDGLHLVCQLADLHAKNELRVNERELKT